MSVTPPPQITVSIVSYNTRDLLRACLHSLQMRQDAGEVTMEIIVADNGSMDGSVGMMREEFPSVACIETGGNIGYGRANNLAVAQARGRYCFILNSDTEVGAGTLAALFAFLETHPDAGAVGAQLVWPDGTPQPSFSRDQGLMTVFREQTYLDQIVRRRPPLAQDAASKGGAREVEQIVGACLFVRREAYAQVGGFDPAYFMYFEDIDLCIRLRQAGWRIWFLPEARITHHLGASSRDWQGRARMIASYNQSRYYFFTHTRGAWQGALLKALVLLGAGLRLCAWSVVSVARPSARIQARLFLAVWRKTWAMKPESQAAP